MKIIKSASTIFLAFLAFSSFAQISPPGLDGTKITTWGVIGFSQALSPKLNLTVYGGAARMSDPDSWNPTQKQGIFVYNHELLYKFSNKWQASVANSFRVQKLYSEEAPYETEDPSYRYELRYYGRIYYKQELRKIGLSYAFRPEVRTFYSPDWDLSSHPLELRFRLKGSANFPLNQDKTNILIGANEILTAIDQYKTPINNGYEHSWSDYHFTEDRFTLYFRHMFKKPDIVLDLGIMEQFKAGGHMDPTSYICFDILIQNPFSKHFN